MGFRLILGTLGGSLPEFAHVGLVLKGHLGDAVIREGAQVSRTVAHDRTSVGQGFLCFPGTLFGRHSGEMCALGECFDLPRRVVRLCAGVDDRRAVVDDIDELADLGVGDQGVLVQRGPFHVEVEVGGCKLLVIRGGCAGAGRGRSRVEDKLTGDSAAYRSHLLCDIHSHGRSRDGSRIREAVPIRLRASDLDFHAGGQCQRSLRRIEFERQRSGVRIILAHRNGYCKAARHHVQRV